MSDYLPEDVVLEILKKLPIEDLVRSIAVCKSWYSLITSPSFVSLHSRHIASTNTKGSLLVRDYYPQHSHKEYFAVLSFDDGKCKSLDGPISKRKEKIRALSQLIPNVYLRVVDCVNGVLCLCDHVDTLFDEAIVLWNPSICKYVTLPQPLFGFCTCNGSAHSNGFIHAIGFGFDSTINDFKVVRVIYLDDDRWESITVPKVEVYEPRVGSWRSVDAKGFSRTIDHCSTQAFLHGTVHWVIGSKNRFKELEITCLIVTFDLGSEVFGVMEVPDVLSKGISNSNYWRCPKEPLRRDFCLSVLGESLALIRDTWSDDPNDANGCCIWVMKEYGVPDSWTKLLNVDVTGCYWRVCGFRSNGEVLVMAGARREQKLVSFDPQRKLVDCICKFGS